MIKRKDGFNGEQALILPQAVISDMEKDPVLSMLHITDIGYYPKAKYHFRKRNEPISQFVFIYCTEGSGWFRVDNQEHIITANQYFVLPAGKSHIYGTNENDPWTIYWIHFKGILSSELSGEISHPLDVKPGTHSRINNRNELFEEIFRSLEMGYSHENLLYANAVFHHYLCSLNCLTQYRNAVHEAGDNTDTANAAIHYMKENLEKKLTLAEIASHVGYSPSHFSVLFNQRTGFTPLNYFNQLKIRQACNFLDFTDMKVNQICYKIGIDDTYYFSRLFNKIMGMSPRAYRILKKG